MASGCWEQRCLLIGDVALYFDLPDRVGYTSVSVLKNRHLH